MKLPERKNQELETLKGDLENHGDALQEALSAQSEKVSELVGKSAQEDIPITPATTPSPLPPKLNIPSFFDRVNALLFPHKEPVGIPETRSKQEKYLKKALTKERNRLLKKINEIENNRHFSPSKLEKTIRQLREIQKLLSNLVHMATNQIKDLYKKYVLKEMF